MTGRLVSAGSILVDLAFRVPHPPEPGGDVLASPPALTVAGGFNLLVAAARQHVPTVYAGTFGGGPYGQLVQRALAEAGIVAANRAADDGDTGVCVVLVDNTAERTFVTAPGVETSVTVHDLARAHPTPADLVAVSGYDLAYPQSGRTTAEWVRSLPAGCRVVLDPGPMVADIPSDLLAQVLTRAQIVSLNRREAGLVGGVTSAGDDPVDQLWHAAVRSAWPLAPDRLLVIRDGARGCTASGGELGAETLVVPAPVVQAVDTTGAGDIHTGVLMAGLLQGRSLLEAARRANVAAAFSVTVPGPAAAPTRSELDALVDDLGGARADNTPTRAAASPDHDSTAAASQT